MDEWVGACFRTPDKVHDLDGWWWGDVRCTPSRSDDCSGADHGTHDALVPWNQGSDNYVQSGLQDASARSPPPVAPPPSSLRQRMVTPPRADHFAMPYYLRKENP